MLLSENANDTTTMLFLWFRSGRGGYCPSGSLGAQKGDTALNSVSRILRLLKQKLFVHAFPIDK